MQPIAGLSKRFVCVISTGLPHPTQGASAVVYAEYIAGLKAAGYDVGVVCLHNPDTTEIVPQIETYYKTKSIRLVACRASAFYEGRFGQYRLASEAVRHARRRAAEFNPDKVVCFDLLAAWVGRELFPGVPRVVWLGDLHFETNWFHALYELREDGPNPRTIRDLARAWVYSFAWRRVYRTVLKDDHDIIVCNKSSEATLANLGIHSSYAPYPWPCSPTSCQREIPKVPTFVFFGNLHGLGSRSALHFLIDELYPLCVRRFSPGGFNIRICGRGSLYPWADAAINARPELQFLGFVDSLDRVLSNCHAMLAPIDVPTGNRTRIVTAMAQRTPVIAHWNTALGNPDLVDGETCLLAGTADEFVAQMIWTVERPKCVARILDRALERYKQNFLPAVANSILIKMLGGTQSNSN